MSSQQARRSCVHPAQADAPAHSETTPRPLSPPRSPSMPSSSRAREAGIGGPPRSRSRGETARAIPNFRRVRLLW